MRKILPFVAALALFGGCETPPPLPAEFRPDPRPEAAWEKQLTDLKCSYHARTLAVRAGEPLAFAVLGYCGGEAVPERNPGLGYLVLVSVDTARNEVRAARIASDSAGGLHYTASGGLMWFSVASPGSRSGSQRFVEVFTAPAGSVEARSLGRLDTPFFAYEPSLSQGESCHVLRSAGLGGPGEAPYQHRLWLLRDDDPIGSAKAVEGPSRALYWNPIGKYFVVQAPKVEKELKRSRMSCSGELGPLPAEEALRLADVTYADASFLALPNGDLVATNESLESSLELMSWSTAMEILVFRTGRPMERIGPSAFDDPRCPDPACDQIGQRVQLMGASPSGQHFLATVDSGDLFIVYRTHDLQRVRRWAPQDPTGRYLPMMVDERTVLQLRDRSPVAYYSW